MRILWVCNLILPDIAKQLNLPSIPKEGWVAGLLDAILAKSNLEIALAFPVPQDLDGCHGSVEWQGKNVSYCGYYEESTHPELYDPQLEERMKHVLDRTRPDLVHLFGTEYPHSLAMARAWGRPEKLLIGIQGPISFYATVYYANMPQRVCNTVTFRDVVRKDSIRMQQKKYEMRGVNEIEAVKLTGHVAGRTRFDKDLTAQWNPKAIYHHAGETLRSVFYEGQWERKKAQKHRIFVSQADYPIKGFHYLLAAAGQLAAQEPYQDLEIYVAGQSVVAYKTLKDKLKLPAYGKYLRELMKQYHMENRIHILGRLSAEEMKKQYLCCDLFACPSACENSPNSLGEAMILGVPAVAANVGGIASVFTDGEDGLLYPCGPELSFEEVVEGLKKAILDTWEQEEETDRRCQNAILHGRRNHDPEANVREMLQIYREMQEMDS